MILIHLNITVIVCINLDIKLRGIVILFGDSSDFFEIYISRL